MFSGKNIVLDTGCTFIRRHLRFLTARQRGSKIFFCIVRQFLTLNFFNTFVYVAQILYQIAHLAQIMLQIGHLAQTLFKIGHLAHTLFQITQLAQILFQILLSVLNPSGYGQKFDFKLVFSTFYAKPHSI